MKYEITSWYKIIEEDNYKKGCGFQGAHSSSYGDKLHLQADTVMGLLEKFTSYLGLDMTYTHEGKEYPSYELNSCDENGRVDFTFTENGDGHKPSEAEYKLFKQGKINLYVVDYTINVSLVKRQVVELELN